MSSLKSFPGPVLIIHDTEAGLAAGGDLRTWRAHEGFASYSEGWRPRTAADDVSGIREWQWGCRPGKVYFNHSVGHHLVWDEVRLTDAGGATALHHIGDGPDITSEDTWPAPAGSHDDLEAIFDLVSGHFTERIAAMTAVAHAAIARVAPPSIPADEFDFCWVGWVPDGAGGVELRYKGPQWAGRASYRSGPDSVAFHAEAAPSRDMVPIDEWVSDGLELSHLRQDAGRWSVSEEWEIEPGRLRVTTTGPDGSAERITVPAAGGRAPSCREVRSDPSAEWTPGGTAALTYRDAAARVATLRRAAADEAALAARLGAADLSLFDAPVARTATRPVAHFEVT